MAKRILVVDDDTVMLEFVTNTLKPHGYEVTCAQGGTEAIHKLREDSFDGVILDFFMPEKDGLDVVGDMFKRRDKTPVVVLSSNLDPHYEAAVQGFGITREVLRKPCAPEMLLQTMERVLNG